MSLRHPRIDPLDHQQPPSGREPCVSVRVHAGYCSARLDTSGTVVLALGVTERTIRVVLVDDTTPEHAETFAVVLSDPTALSPNDPRRGLSQD